MSFTWMESDGVRHLLQAGQVVGTIAPGVLPEAPCTDEVEELAAGVYRWRRRWRITRPVNRYGLRLTMDFVAGHTPRFAMIPGVNYNGNEWGTGEEPKGFARDGQTWSFAYHRTAVSGASYSEGGTWAVALFGELDAAGPFSCALAPGEGATTHQLVWPEEERPRVYRGRDRYAGPYQGELALNDDGTVTTTAYLVVGAVGAPRTGWRRFLEVAWERGFHAVAPWFSPERLWELGVRFTKESLWAEQGVFRGFHNGLIWQEGQWVQRPRWRYEIGWVGRNASRGCALLADHLRTGDRDSRAKGAAALDCWAEHARLPNGLMRCHFDDVLGIAEEPEVQDACNLGGAARYYLEAADLAARAGLARPQYAETGLALCDFAVRAQSPEGRIGRMWANDGTCLDPNGTIGAFFLPALLAAHRVSGQQQYLLAAQRGYEYYVAELMENGYTTAGALDTHCIDRESATPLLEAGLALHDATGESRYVEWAEHAAYYLATWQWHHTVPYAAGSALHAMGYDTFGGTSVSTQHHHIDPYAIAFVPGWLRLAEVTGKEQWRQRALAAWANGSMGVSEGELMVMGRRRPAGSQDEGFLHTRWGDGASVSQWLVAWPTAFRLEVMRELPDWRVLDWG